MRAVIYARYSSDLQSEASIEDQLEVCRRYIEKQGWTLVRVYKDAAVSGSSRFRPDYQKLLSDLDGGVFDTVVVEALDRLGRKLADVADLHDRCAFAGIKLVATNAGEITAMHVGMLGTMAQLFLSDLRAKTWRGQLGRALQGKLPGGKAYGYEVTGTGERRIIDAESAVVRRIFGEFAAGRSPRAIAKRLNSEGVPGPAGRPWGDTTIRGQVDRGTGILNNALYVGRLDWNRCSYVKDPRTGKRVARPNPADKWESSQVPHLRIIDDDLWERVKARQRTLQFEISRDARGNALNRVHRRKFLLSGLLVCGSCGGGYTIIGPDRYGCATRRSKGTCGNTHVIARQDLEERVLSTLRERMMAPALVDAFVKEFNTELHRISGEAQRERIAARSALDGIERKVAKIVRAIEDGAYHPTLKARLTALESERTAIEAKLAGIGDTPVLRLHPNLPALYRSKVEKLAVALGEPGTASEAGEILRSLIERIVLTPKDGALRAELYGDLVVLAGFAQNTSHKSKNPGSQGKPGLLSVVAGRGFEPLTFRL